MTWIRNKGETLYITSQKKLINKFPKTINKIAYLQLGICFLFSIPFFFTGDKDIVSGLVLAGFTSFLYTQLIRLGSFNTVFALLGYPIRLIACGIPCAILVHKFHSNLLALFTGFTISQIVFFYFIYKYSKETEQEQ